MPLSVAKYGTDFETMPTVNSCAYPVNYIPNTWIYADD